MTGLANILNIVGLSLGFLGSLILAFSLNRLQTAVFKFLRFLDIIQYVDTRRRYPTEFDGLLDQVIAGNRSTGRRTRLGLALLALSFVFQLVAVLVSSSAP